MNIQLTEVLSDVMGLTGGLIIRDIVAGERDPKALARHRHSRVKASPEEIIKALTGNWREEHLFVLRQSLGMFDDIERHLVACDTKLHAGLKDLGEREVDLGKAPRAGSQAASDVRCPSDTGQLGWCRPHPHQRAGLGGGQQDTD